MTDVLIEGGIWTHTLRGRTPCEDEGRHEGDVSTNQEMLRITRQPLEVRWEAQILWLRW